MGLRKETSHTQSAGATGPQQTHAATGMASFALSQSHRHPAWGALGRLRGRQAPETVPRAWGTLPDTESLAATRACGAHGVQRSSWRPCTRPLRKLTRAQAGQIQPTPGFRLIQVPQVGGKRYGASTRAHCRSQPGQRDENLRSALQGTSRPAVAGHLEVGRKMHR